eukprot:TRINITY_DN4297_c0_g1_i1.p1 TRINITY_DN4297_c0_g1~~TRINITY_DN4297_c0_g1_i1.p1  ORF type:complete len:291 (-),score=71.31 TRINITY_DN4297_c0_g1_i1:103-975(-)
MECFDSLPLAATVSTVGCGTFFCCHGGIGPGIHTLDDIRQIGRFKEVPLTGNFCDLLWADPVNESDAIGLPHSMLQDWYNTDFKPNTVRGASFYMYYQAVSEFCESNNFTSIIRGHEVMKFGYCEHRYRKKEREHPLVITIFSAPNYCDMYENLGAYIKLGHTSYDFVEVAWVDHPYVLPDFQNVFAFSLPFIAENLSKFCMNILTLCTEEPDQVVDKAQSGSRIRAKVRNVSRLMLILKDKRIENEKMLNPASEIIGQVDGLEERFEKVAVADAKEEYTAPESPQEGTE